MADWLALLRPLDAIGPYLHTARRLKERHSLSITPDEYLRLCQRITTNLPYLKTAPSGAPGRVRVQYPFGGQVLPLIVDTGDGLIVTVLDGERPLLDYPEPRERKPRHKRRGTGRQQRRKWTRYDVD